MLSHHLADSLGHAGHLRGHHDGSWIAAGTLHITFCSTHEMHSVDISHLEANPELRLSSWREVGACWRHSPLPSRRVLDRSTGVNWFLADEVTAELSIVEALQKPSTYYSLGTFPFPPEPFHFLSLVRKRAFSSACQRPPWSDAIMLLFSHHCWEWMPLKLPHVHPSSLDKFSPDPRHHLVICLCGEAILYCTAPLWCRQWIS